MMFPQRPNELSRVSEETIPAPPPLADTQSVLDIADALSPLDTALPVAIQSPSTPVPERTDKLAQQRVQHAQAASGPDFTACYERYSRPLYAFVFFTVGNKEDTDEIIQETFIAASRSWSKIRTFEERPLQQWLYTTANNKTMDHFRHWRNRIQHWTRYKERAVKERAPHEPLDEPLPNERVQGFLKILSRQERQCLILLSQGLDYDEIADMLKIQPSAVRAYIARARKKCRRADEEMQAASKRNGE